MGYYNWGPYVSVAERQRIALQRVEKLRKKGVVLSPVVLQGRNIATTFWGTSWCKNLEHYSDFSSRLPRGRTYVRNGSVIDLQITPGEVRALVIGSEVYNVVIKVSSMPKAHWQVLCADCASAIESLVELLQGRFSKGVMERMCQQKNGMFPSQTEIEFSCTCPDWALMCKHVAAVLYGIGSRLDQHPELLFLLRQVDHKAMIAKAGKKMSLSKKKPSKKKILAEEGLSDLFGLELGTASEEEAPPSAKTKRKKRNIAKTKSVAGDRKKPKSVGPRSRSQKT